MQPVTLSSPEAHMPGELPAGASLSFAADNAAAGQFSVRATAGGVSKSVGPLPVAAGATLDQDFAFP